MRFILVTRGNDVVTRSHHWLTRCVLHSSALPPTCEPQAARMSVCRLVQAFEAASVLYARQFSQNI